MAQTGAWTCPHSSWACLIFRHSHIEEIPNYLTVIYHLDIGPPISPYITSFHVLLRARDRGNRIPERCATATLLVLSIGVRKADRPRCHQGHPGSPVDSFTRATPRAATWPHIS